MSHPLLSIRELSVDFETAEGWKPVTHGVSLDIVAGQTLALVGESGSGKSVTAMSVLALLPLHTRRRGSILFTGEDLLCVPDKRLQQIRGRDIAMIFQEPMTALNPVYTIGRQLIEVIQSHRQLSTAAAKERALELLRSVNIPEPEKKFDHYPHQLSGGQRQRAMIAMAVSSEPKLLIADEPTTAIDVTVQVEILDLILELQSRLGMAVLIITHNMGVVADIADRVVVMRNGRVVEEGGVEDVFVRPREAYTRELLAAVPYLGRAEKFLGGLEPGLAVTESTTGDMTTTVPVLELTGARISYPGSWRKAGFQAVHGVDLTIERGEIVGLVGESGSGKSTIGRAVLGLLPLAGGTLKVHGTDVSHGTRALARQRRGTVSMVFQDPASSLNPRRTIAQAITDPLRWQGIQLRGMALRERAMELLEQVRISGSWADRYPHELSGGQRQRVGIARAIAIEPMLMVADEPTSALDVSVQASVLELFLELQRSYGFSCLFISHDLSVVEALANRVIVLQKGVVIEQGSTRDVLQRPQAEYTRQLIAAAPVPDPTVQQQRRQARTTG
ncbi:MAG: glutathione ABC transporter ATP-binding protein [Candidatus Lumbricidophila eiseniae]|uniref:Glutathione ABC transporter ATP-binding protein n=1 Tax=Candidatus Lumbricidiphila eiseniae TaxID=1969409 RepID=A0A2A6FRC0_9MICO|nr:MAG: glutathione ABC transporter ATP-binding protein [Candidatus Lumbricidophila eiseniae]